MSEDKKGDKLSSYAIAACIIFTAVKLSQWVGELAEPSETDIFMQRVELATGSVELIHRGGCWSYRTNFRKKSMNVSDYVKFKDHVYCSCVEEELMDKMSVANLSRELVLDDIYFHYFDEYRGEIYHRMKDFYCDREGGWIEHVYNDGEFHEATTEDREILRKVMYNK